MANMARLEATAVKQKIESQLASRIPAALSPMTQPEVRRWPTGVVAVDRLLGGGLPLGSLCEITAPECAGRTSLALALLASATREGVTAYLDVSDALSPHSAAAAGISLPNLLWVRFAKAVLYESPAHTLPPPAHAKREPEHQQQHCGGPHPRGETKGLAPALEQMLFLKDERQRRKMEGTPGYPNQHLGLGEASADQVQWEQFNSRAIDDRDPLRAMDRASADAARHRATSRARTEAPQPTKQRPWTLLDQALRATDQILQAGGFRVVVLDLASLPVEKAQRIPAASWWRFQKAAKNSDTIFLVLTPAPCARSTAACVLECLPTATRTVDGVLSSVEYRVEVSRQRTGAPLERKAPGRVASWDVAPAWMRAVGR